MEKTCKDCVHVEVCRHYVGDYFKDCGIELKTEKLEALLDASDCEFFIDRARLDVIEKARQALEKFPKAVK